MLHITTEEQHEEILEGCAELYTVTVTVIMQIYVCVYSPRTALKENQFHMFIEKVKF